MVVLPETNSVGLPPLRGLRDQRTEGDFVRTTSRLCRFPRSERANNRWVDTGVLQRAESSSLAIAHLHDEPHLDEESPPRKGPLDQVEQVSLSRSVHLPDPDV